MLYEAVAGKRPFARPRPTEEVAATLLGAYARLTAADRRASEELAGLIARCLATDPTARPTAHALADALRAQIDWMPLEQLAAERAAVIADPVGYQARIAAFRVRRLERLAREAIDAGKPFAALASCDRGLAYTPDHAALLALIATAEAATARRAPAEVAAPDGPDGPAGPTGPTGPVAPGGAPHRVESGAAPRVVAAPTVTTWRSRKPIVLAIGATLLAIGGIVAIVALLAGPAKREDPWASSSSPSSATVREPASMMAEGDRALLRDFVGLFGRAMDASERSGATPSGARPTTATGWFELAKTQPPAEAVTSLRHALRTNPEWPAAQDALCVALAGTKDEGAIEVCSKAIARSPTDLALRGARGATLVLARRPVEALADLDIVVAGDPAPMWRRVRAAARSAAGDDAGAAQDLAHACQLGDAVACQARR
jgi:hypothetical protein